MKVHMQTQQSHQETIFPDSEGHSNNLWARQFVNEAVVRTKCDI